MEIVNLVVGVQVPPPTPTKHLQYFPVALVSAV